MIETPTPAAGLPRFDPAGADFLADRYRVFDDYRRHDSVHWNGDPSGKPSGHWYIFDHRSAVTALKDSRFCRQPVGRRGSCPVTHAGSAAAPAAPPSAFAAVIANCMLFQDPPRHTRLRNAVNPSFAPPVTRALRPFIERRAHELLAPLRPAETFDFIREFAVPFPLDVIGDLLGVPASERATFRLWSAALRDGIDRPKWGSDALVRAEAATLGLRDYFEAAWQLHRREPNESVLGDLFRLEGQEAGLSKDEAFGTFIVLISAGHETTTNLLGNGMYLFARHPTERELLREQPELVSKAVEEILRCESPVQMVSRFVAEETRLGGQHLLPGQHVEIMLGSANRDPTVFTEPSRFNIARASNPHLTFGLGGNHCIGAPIARLIGSIALPILLERVRPLGFPPAANPWTSSMGFRGLRNLPAVLG